MTEPAITGSLAGVAFSFRCAPPALMTYARLHLQPLLAAPVEAPVVSSTLRWHEGQPPLRQVRAAAQPSRWERVDRDLYVAPGALRWFRVDDLRDLFLRISWTGDRLEVEGDFYYRLGNSTMSDTIRRLRQWRRRADLSARRFPTLLAYLVYYPCWWWLEQTRDVHPIHAAGVATAAGAIVLAGASGIGKSTLSVALGLTPQARFLSDSFVLHYGAEVFPVREPILLDARSRAWLGAASGELIALQRRYGLRRSGYQFPVERLADKARAAVLVFPRQSSAPAVRRLSPDAAHQRLSAGDLLINDLRRYWAFAAVMEQLVPGGLMVRREAQLAELVASAPAYEFGLSPTTSCEAATASLLELLDDRPLRVAGGRP